MGWLRHIKTTQERRENGKRDVVLYDDIPIKIRAKRNAARLPDVRCDIQRSCFWDRSWKGFRKTQYK